MELLQDPSPPFVFKERDGLGTNTGFAELGDVMLKPNWDVGLWTGYTVKNYRFSDHTVTA